MFFRRKVEKKEKDVIFIIILILVVILAAFGGYLLGGKFFEFENIIKFYTVAAIPKDGPLGGYMTIVDQQANGDYYNMYNILYDAGIF